MWEPCQHAHLQFYTGKNTRQAVHIETDKLLINQWFQPFMNLPVDHQNDMIGF